VYLVYNRARPSVDDETSGLRKAQGKARADARGSGGRNGKRDKSRQRQRKRTGAQPPNSMPHSGQHRDPFLAWPGNLSHPALKVDLTIAADVNRAVVKMTKLTGAAALSRNCRVQVRCHDPRAMCCVFILHAALCHGWDRLLASPGRYMRRARMTTGLRPAVIARGDFPGVMNSSLFMHPPFWDESDLMVLRKSGYLGDVNLVKSRRHNDERRPAVLSLCQFPRQTVLIGPSLPEYLSLLKNSLNLRLRCIAGVC
jgi:hypothetical protein